MFKRISIWKYIKEETRYRSFVEIHVKPHGWKKVRLWLSIGTNYKMGKDSVLLCSIILGFNFAEAKEKDSILKRFHKDS